jgi:hypothetical protein
MLGQQVIEAVSTVRGIRPCLTRALISMLLYCESLKLQSRLPLQRCSCSNGYLVLLMLLAVIDNL